MIKEHQISSFIEKISILENKFGATIHHNFLNSLDFNASDIVSIQNLTRDIANFMGLKDFTFIVGIAPQKKNVGAHIDLFNNTDKDIFIELSPDVSKHKEAILATISHELSHKLLAINSLEISVGSPQPLYIQENEVLTDITAIYFGLGKFMLNGCECEYTEKKHKGSHIETITHSMKTGYLTAEQFSFIYAFICGMRQINLSDSEKFLNKRAKNILKKVRKKYFNNFEKIFQKNSENQILNNFKKELLPTQKLLALIDRNVKNIKLNSLELAQDQLYKTHTKIKEISDKLENENKDFGYNTALKYLKLFKSFNITRKFFDELEFDNKNLNYHKNLLNKMNQLILSFNVFNRGNQNEIDLEVHTCMLCKTKFKIPKNKNYVKTRCTNIDCNYEMIIDTMNIEKRHNFISKSFQKIKSIFRNN